MDKSPTDDCELQQRQEKERVRKRNLYLTISGVVSLLLPLLGVAYMRMSDALQPARKNVGNTVFSRRAGEPGAKKKITPARVSAAQLPNPLTVEVLKPSSDPKKPAPGKGPTQDSLSLIRRGAEYYKDKKPEPPPTSPAPIPPKPEPKKAPPNPAKKSFVAPKLKGNTRFGDFKSKEQLQQVLPQNQEMPDMEALMKQVQEGN